MQIPFAGSEQFEREESVVSHMHSPGHFSWWHRGWMITEVSTHLSRGLSLPVFFQNLCWDEVNEKMVMHTYPVRSDEGTAPCLVQLKGAGDISVHIMSIRPPMRLLQIDTQTGETTTIRLELWLDQRRIYEQVAGLCPIQSCCGLT